MYSAEINAHSSCNLRRNSVFEIIGFVRTGRSSLCHKCLVSFKSGDLGSVFTTLGQLYKSHSLFQLLIWLSPHHHSSVRAENIKFWFITENYVFPEVSSLNLYSRANSNRILRLRSLVNGFFRATRPLYSSLLITGLIVWILQLLSFDARCLF